MKRPALEIQAFRAVMGKLSALVAQAYTLFGIKDEFAEIVSYEDSLIKNSVELFDGEGKHVSGTIFIKRHSYLGNYHLSVSPNGPSDLDAPRPFGNCHVDGLSSRQFLVKRRLQVQRQVK